MRVIKKTTYVAGDGAGIVHAGEIEAGMHIVTGQPYLAFADDNTGNNRENYYTSFEALATEWEQGFDMDESWKGRPVKYENEIYVVIRPHTTQSDWTPATTPSLFRHIPKPASGQNYPAWKQPTGAHNAYNVDDIVVYESNLWKSKINANTTAPDGDQPYNRYWEPYNE